MCGISGTIALTGDLEPSEHRLLTVFNELLRHRGPDGEGVLAGCRCAIGNTRLAVIDPSPAGALPMANDDGSIWLAYSGEISNFGELRRHHRLAELYRLRGRSDAEILLRLYELLGPEAFGQLSGMFAFCLVDFSRRQAFLVRDFFGIMPLFYCERHGRLHFASELNALLAIPGFERRPDITAAAHFFSLAYVPESLTAFAGINELCGGEYLEVGLHDGRWQRRQYYRPEQAYGREPDCGLAEATEAVRAGMVDAVQRSLEADAAVGICLSGGVDSTALVALSAQIAPRTARHTFGLRIPGVGFDESPFQRLVADHFGTVHHQVEVSALAIAGNFDRYVAHLGEPFGDGSAIPLMMLAETAHPLVKVLLSGEGGDELFMGYDTYRAWRCRDLYRALAPSPVRRLMRKAAAALPVSMGRLSLDFRLKRFTAGSELTPARSHYYWRHVLSREARERLLPATAGIPDSADLFEQFFGGCSAPHELERLAALDLRFLFHGDLMLESDRMFFSWSVEGRYPLADRLLFEQVAALPTSWKLRGLTPRYVQRQALQGLVPDAVLQRSKVGMELPYSRWLRGELSEFAQHRLRRELVEATGLLAWPAVQQLWNEHQQGVVDHGRPLWCLISFLTWFDLFILSTRYRSLLGGRQ